VRDTLFVSAILTIAMSSSSEVLSPEERVHRYSRNLAAMGEIKMLLSQINLQHAEIEADAKEAVLFVRLAANARANAKLRQKRKAIARKWIATGATAKATAKATALAKAKAKAKARRLKTQ